MTSDGVRKAIRRACKAAGSQQEWAAQIGIKPAFLSQVLRGEREPSPAILKPLGLVKAVVYRRVK